MGSTAGGTYTLLVELTTPADVTVGSLGATDLPSGHYAYTGSAFGPGGFARVDRHRAVAAGVRDVAHWHVDYLLGLADAGVVAAVRSPGTDAECTIAARIGTDSDVTARIGAESDVADRGGEADVEAPAVEGFGATDCGCRGHLAYAPERAPLYEAVWTAHVAVRDGTGPGGEA